MKVSFVVRKVRVTLVVLDTVVLDVVPVVRIWTSLTVQLDGHKTQPDNSDPSLRI